MRQSVWHTQPGRGRYQWADVNLDRSCFFEKVDEEEGLKENKTAETELPLPVWKEKETDWRTQVANDRQQERERKKENRRVAAKPSSMKTTISRS